MRCRNQGTTWLVAVLWLAWLAPGEVFGAPAKNAPPPVVLVVMDPLAKELACACVKRYGQRDYRKLAARLELALKHPVGIEFTDDLAETLALVGVGRELVVIGEPSLIADGAKRAAWKGRPVAELTGLDGATTITALFVTRASDPAKGLKDIAGRKLLMGVAEADAKHAAALAALRAAGIEPLAKPTQRTPYSDAAMDVLDSSGALPPVAVVPSYALRLLEGCGSITPGALKVIGTTAAVPFITAFVSDQLPPAKEQVVLKTLLDLKRDAALLKVMESRDGFQPMSAPAAKPPSANADWPDWRGPNRDAQVPRLPKRLPATAKLLWKKAGLPGSLAGLSVSAGRLLLAERDVGDELDVYRCLSADTGELLWRIEFPARGKLDYGQSPRATPVLHGGRAYLLGAFGELRCVNLTDGKLVWKRHLPREFQAELPTWGMCAPPLVVDDLLIVNPGGPKASLVALDCGTGRTRWATPGLPAAYAPFICGEFGGRRQIVGYDQKSLGGWDVKTGQRLWQLVPPTEGDFNVPTPIAVDGGVLLATENNGARLYRFDGAGRILPQPAAVFADLAPDTATPVVTAGRVFGAHRGLRCLDVRQGLKPVWHRAESALDDHATLFADAERVLVITHAGELLLLDAQADACTILSRLRVFADDVEMYSHPALAGSRLYLRGGYQVVCVDLAAN